MKTLLHNNSTRVLPNYIHEEGQIIDTKLDKVLAEKIKPFHLNNF